MSMIDVSTWKQFRVGDLFVTMGNGNKQQVPTGCLVPKAKLVDGPTPRITVTNTDNGIVGYYADISDMNYRVYENFISVSFLGTVFYQKEKASLDMKVHCLQLKDRPLTDNTGSFLVTILRDIISKYSYASQLSSKMLPDLMISLPATPSGEPDRDYMENYMKAVMEQEEVFAEHLASLTAEAVADGHPIDVSAWGEFRVGDLFEVCKGTRLTKANMVDGNTPFIGSSAENNGITSYISNDSHVHEGHAITVCYNGSVGETFYQKDAFWASDDVNVLRPKCDVSMNIMLFLSTIIKKIGKSYTYVDKWRLDKMINDCIKLPVTPSGEPDWAYMEQFMQQQMDKSQQLVEHLDQIWNS